jgi:hypothetical protein
MEVHAHTHTPRKKWTHYFWEFLMLFLAVFFGSLAENKREHIIERQRERQYINSMLSDLKEDTINISLSIAGNINKVNGLDTLSTLLNTTNLSDSIHSKLYRLNAQYASNINTAAINERTIKQLLSSGNMRLIHEQQVSDSIMQYYGQFREDLIGQERIYEESMKRVVFYGEDIFDNYFRKPKLTSDTSFFREKQPDLTKLLTTEKNVLKKYTSMLITASAMSAYYLSMLIEIRKRAIDLIAFLREKYDIK